MESLNGDLISPNTQKIILICQDLFENILMPQLNMTLEGLFIVEKQLPIQITDQEQVIIKDEISLPDLSAKQTLDLKPVRFPKDKILISSLAYNSDLQCQDPAIVKNDQDAQHGRCLLLKDFKKKP